MGIYSDKYLVPCAYCIVLLDFISALLFTIISGLVFHKHGNASALAALLFTIFWMVIIVILAAGIYKRKVKLVRFWLVFTCLGIILDGVILLYGLTLAIAVNWDGVKVTVLPFVGLAVEMTFVYIIYLFYPYVESESQDCERYPRSNAGFTMEFEDEIQEKVEEKARDRKKLKRLEKNAKERIKKEKAALKELKKQMRKS
ncbi:uncharacterized protein [Drosophila kikkawai]|uniref:Uncharacterized protein n=1 Tax=Drosophila kikkawai TaxID=30033 RepID=A0A6P4I6M6_DROKI|nr:uncharacterized protein LOC108071905 [Drosophila kikkawai]